MQEVILAVWLELSLSKREILELYLNRVYLGAGAYGVDAAAQRYFGKSAKDVTLAEAATLAGLLKAPTRYSPLLDRDGVGGARAASSSPPCTRRATSTTAPPASRCPRR